MGALLDIVIVNWNSGRQLAECLATLKPALERCPGTGRVIVVDNGSTDGSFENLGVSGPDILRIHNDVNRGFSAACNQGAKGGDAKYVLFLNPDTRLEPDSLSVPLAYLESAGREGVGIVGIQLLDDAGSVSRTCVRFPTPARFLGMALGLDRFLPGRFRGHFMTDWAHDETREVDQVMGAFFLVRRRAFELLGGFDERFFVYFEELDFSLRARKSGFASVYLASARAYHRGGGVSEQVKGIRLFYSLRSRILYGYKHFGLAGGTAVLITSACLEPLTRVVLAIARLSIRGVGETLEGYAMLWHHLPGILAGARRAGG